MEMLRYLGLAVLVVCIAAFASGCGGGGGGSAMEEETPVMECPQGQVGTYPNCMDPPPTDEQRIDAAQDTLAGIIADARTREGLARADASAVEGHADATEAQKTSAGSLGDAARNALTDIVTASAVVNVATTGAQAEGAVSDAQAALNDLISAQQSLASLLSAVNAVAGARRQLEEDEKLATNGSSLIQHVRDNKKVYDAVIGSLDADSITVGPTVDGTNNASYPNHTGSDATIYPRPSDAESGVRAVTITVGGGGSALSSTSTTGSLSGTGTLPNGFDLKNADSTQFANAYTDIRVATRVRAKNSAGDNAEVDDTSTMAIDERYEYVADADYLVAGIWLNDSGTADPPLGAFAYGSQAIDSGGYNFCTAADVADTTTLTRECGATAGLHTITTLVGADKDKSATYNGDVNGAYLAGGAMSYFEADVSLTAEFVNTGGTTGAGTISGAVTNIVAGGKSIAGSLDLKEQALGNDISGAFNGGDVAGVVAGNAYIGNWKGQFFGMKYDKKTTARNTDTDPDTVTTTYTPGLPGSVAGTFYATQQTAPAGSAAFIGAFGAHR